MIAKPAARIERRHVPTVKVFSESRRMVWTADMIGLDLNRFFEFVEVGWYDG